MIMSAKTLGGRLLTVPDQSVRRMKGRAVWRIASLFGFVLSGLLFISGFVVSLATALGAVPVSRASAYLTVGLLLTGFASAFFGAHALDEMDEPRAADGAGSDGA